MAGFFFRICVWIYRYCYKEFLKLKTKYNEINSFIHLTNIFSRTGTWHVSKGNCYFCSDFLLVLNLQVSKLYTLIANFLLSILICPFFELFFLPCTLVLKEFLLAWTISCLHTYLNWRWASLNVGNADICSFPCHSQTLRTLSSSPLSL